MEISGNDVTTLLLNSNTLTGCDFNFEEKCSNFKIATNETTTPYIKQYILG